MFQVRGRNVRLVFHLDSVSSLSHRFSVILNISQFNNAVIFLFTVLYSRILIPSFCTCFGDRGQNLFSVGPVAHYCLQAYELYLSTKNHDSSLTSCPLGISWMSNSAQLSEPLWLHAFTEFLGSVLASVSQSTWISQALGVSLRPDK